MDDPEDASFTQEVVDSSLARLLARRDQALEMGLGDIKIEEPEIYCTKCKKWRPRTEFWKGNRKVTLPDGEVMFVHNYCKECVYRYEKELEERKRAQVAAGILEANSRKKPGAKS